MKSQPVVIPQPWDEVKEKIKEHHIDLTDDDLRFSPGQEDELLGRLQQKMGKSREEVIMLIESIASNTGKAN